ncbi:hypothetical protein [Ammoniphilus sp. YIM 78166]|uniref:hypothetical protein n=1 Tax=Ammoniphilus sp. YIM 78166 TaxID=1644106 RepID=UPI00142F5620|nr:hypothetical protein [Ammoniphilus sp. YIM 78166]
MLSGSPEREVGSPEKWWGTPKSGVRTPSLRERPKVGIGRPIHLATMQEFSIIVSNESINTIKGVILCMFQ